MEGKGVRLVTGAEVRQHQTGKLHRIGKRGAITADNI